MSTNPILVVSVVAIADEEITVIHRKESQYVPENLSMTDLIYQYEMFSCKRRVDVITR